jgi:hypothetical protein
MKTLINYFIVICILLVGSLHAQNWPAGARSAALGHASSSLIDIWASYNNQAALAFLEQAEVGALYENRFLLPEMATQALAFAAPVKKFGTFGVNFYRFGSTNYNENKVGFAYARTFGPRFSAGIQFNLHYIQFGDAYYGNLITATGELSLLVKVTDDWHLSAHVFNPTRTPLAEFDREKIATILRIGTSYRFSEKLLSVLEVSHDILFEPTFRAGLEYQLAEPVFARIGISTNPVAPTFGLGLKLKNFQLDATAQWHQFLGFGPQAGLSYRFGK